jgi:2-methylcitrate dehydratase PrpD
MPATDSRLFMAGAIGIVTADLPPRPDGGARPQRECQERALPEGVRRREIAPPLLAPERFAMVKSHDGGDDTMSAQTEITVTPMTRTLSEYISAAATRELPAAVAEKTGHHILDTLAAILSGSRLIAGRLAIGYVSRLGGSAEATLIGTPLVIPAEHAALANGIAGHADETDDSHLRGRYHPGCGIVPAALAVAELKGCSGADFVRAVALGYDIGTRFNMSLGYPSPNAATHSTHTLGVNFGAAAAAAALLRFDPVRVRYLLSYAVQQASGCPYWYRDSEHVEKAFDFGGMGARNGVTGAMMVAAGMTAVEEPFIGQGNFFDGFALKPDPNVLTEGLGTRYEIMEASIKKWCVGSPIQAVLDATTALVGAHKIRAEGVKHITITMPDDRMHIVNNREIPDICVQYLTALAIVDGTVTFAAAHDEGRMGDAAVQAVRGRIELIPSPELTVAKPARQAIVEIELADGRKVRHHAKAVRGTPDNPMTTKEIEDKAVDLIAPISGADKAKGLVAAVAKLGSLRSVRELRPLLQA